MGNWRDWWERNKDLITFILVVVFGLGVLPILVGWLGAILLFG